MAITENIYGEGLKGQGPIPQAQGVFMESATQKAVLGTRVAFDDGRVFRYFLANGNITPGKLCKAGLGGETNKAVAVAAAIGAKTVYVTTAAAQTGLAEGFMSVNDATGEGITYKIKSSAANATTATSTDVTLYDPIFTALTTSSEVTLLESLYRDVALSTAETDVIVGICNVNVTDDYYGWIQTWGLVAVLCEGAPAVGTAVKPAATNGAVTTQTAGTQYLGRQVIIGVDDEYRLMHLELAP